MTFPKDPNAPQPSPALAPAVAGRPLSPTMRTRMLDRFIQAVKAAAADLVSLAPADSGVLTSLAGWLESQKEHPDTRRLDWLAERVVNVREGGKAGSRNLFWANPADDDGEPGPSDIREQIDAARFKR